MSENNTLLKTPLFEQHQALGARIVDFGGWALPVNYSSQIEEHHSVRNSVGMFDVSHMTVSDITGKETVAFLKYLLANDIGRALGAPGKALYSCMLSERGGVIDDLIIYHLSRDHFRMVTNGATNQKVMAWLRQQSWKFADVVVQERPELALIAVQGPNAIETVSRSFSDDSRNDLASMVNGLSRFQGDIIDDVFIGRTGYTGEDGVEIIVPEKQAVSIWTRMLKAGVQPCGLGARDTLRLEAGMALYGADLDEQHTPLESGLAWTVAMRDDRDFIGRSALIEPSKHKMIGLQLEGKGVLRGHQSVFLDDNHVGTVTSGSFSPSLNRSIALARVQDLEAITVDNLLQVEIRKKYVPARVMKYPFITK
jgi:aminomethyltransferase